MSRWRRSAATAGMVVAVLVAAWLLGPFGPDRIVAPPPEIVADVPLDDELEPSSLAVPVLVDLRTLVAEVEEEVPTEGGSEEQPHAAVPIG